MTCWASTSSAPGRKISGSSSPVLDRVERGARLEIFEAVAGDEDRLARLVEPVVGAADPLQQPRRALGRAHLDDQVDIAPVDAEIEAGGADQAAQPPVGHRRLDLAPRLDATASRDGCRSADAASLTAHRSWKISSARLRVLQKTSVVLCRSISRITFCAAQRPAMARPGDLLVLGQHDRDLGLGARIALDQRRPSRHRRAARASPDRPRDRRRSRTAPTRRSPGASRLQPRQRQREQVAALAGGEGVDLVDHDRLQALRTA